MPGPGLLIVLMVAGLVLDTHSTWLCLRAGYRETNPLMRRATPTSVLRASARLGALMAAVFLLALALESRPELFDGRGEALRENLLYLLSVASITKIFAAFENYLLYRYATNIATGIFGRLRRRGNIAIDMLATLCVVVLPAMALTSALFPAFRF